MCGGDNQLSIQSFCKPDDSVVISVSNVIEVSTRGSQQRTAHLSDHVVSCE